MFMNEVDYLSYKKYQNHTFQVISICTRSAELYVDQQSCHDKNIIYPRRHVLEKNICLHTRRQRLNQNSLVRKIKLFDLN